MKANISNRHHHHHRRRKGHWRVGPQSKEWIFWTLVFAALLIVAVVSNASALANWWNRVSEKSIEQLIEAMFNLS